VGFTTDGSGVITVAPKNSSETGQHATLGKFVSEYGHGFELSTSTLRYPGSPALTNGDVCAKGTPDAGKQGVVIVYVWPNFEAKKGAETSGAPQDLMFANGQLITMAFVPATVAVPKPPAKAITNLITAVTSGTASTTTTLPTTVPSSTTPSATTPTPTTTPTATTQKPAGSGK
jgi:hypothetical protein